MNVASNWISAVLASRPITPRSKASTGACGRSASTPIGSCRWTTPGAILRTGGGTIMRFVPTPHCSGRHRRNSPARQGKRPCLMHQPSRNFLLQTGTNFGVRSHLQARTDAPDLLELERRLLADELSLVPAFVMAGGHWLRFHGILPLQMKRIPLSAEKFVWAITNRWRTLTFPLLQPKTDPLPPVRKFHKRLLRNESKTVGVPIRPAQFGQRRLA